MRGPFIHFAMSDNKISKFIFSSTHIMKYKIKKNLILILLYIKAMFWTVKFKFYRPSRGVLIERGSENKQEIYSRTLMPKSDFNKVALQLYSNYTLAWVFSSNFICGFIEITLWQGVLRQLYWNYTLAWVFSSNFICDFIEITLWQGVLRQLYWNHTLAWMFSCKFVA